jgi:hypothetical protein
MRLQLNQSAARCSSDSFGSADDIHLRKDRFHVRFHSALTNKEGRADLLVAFALPHELEHIDFAFALRLPANTLGKFGREMNRDARLPGVHSADAIHQRFTRHVFEKITFRASLNGTVNIFVAVERR